MLEAGAEADVESHRGEVAVVLHVEGNRVAGVTCDLQTAALVKCVDDDLQHYLVSSSKGCLCTAY